MTTRLPTELVPAFRDNYIFIIRDPDSGAVGIVDPGDAGPVIGYLEQHSLTPTDILLTHHHPDHIGGMEKLKARYGVHVHGPAGETERIPAMDSLYREGDTLTFGSKIARVFEIPGHTRGHIAFWFADDNALFCGDTLFALGCGRMFEGTAEQMWQSLCKLRALPDDTVVYCAHEYTQANARFAVTIEPDNDALTRRAADIDAQRAAGEPTVPSVLSLEKQTNPFLRADVPAVKETIGMPQADATTAFAEIRRRKDSF